tara:strand:- start:629 stop:919 length:291 start_codon:yes stop_codon:yes gene_type:complete
MNEGEPIKWRVHFNQLISRPIPETEFPTIAQRMLDDGLVAVINGEGLRWFSGRYRVTATVVRDMWGLSEHQYKRFYRWVYMNDAFMSLTEGNDDEV